jgi:hypothetical protein
MLDKVETLKKILSTAKTYNTELNNKDLLVLAHHPPTVTHHITISPYISPTHTPP